MANRQASPTEDRDQQVLRRLSTIEQKVHSIDQTETLNLRANADHFLAYVKTVFQGKRRAQVYLLANGKREVNEIAKLVSMRPTDVSRELTTLSNENFVEVIDKEGGKVFWGKSSFERQLNVSRFLMKEFGLDKNGNLLNKKNRPL